MACGIGSKSMWSQRIGGGTRSREQTVGIPSGFDEDRHHGSVAAALGSCASFTAPYSALARGSTAQPGKTAALQECRVAAEDQPHKILENGLLDRGARELQRDALQTIDVDEDHGHDSCLMVHTKRDPRRDHGRN